MKTQLECLKGYLKLIQALQLLISSTITTHPIKIITVSITMQDKQDQTRLSIVICNSSKCQRRDQEKRLKNNLDINNLRD